MDYLAKTGNISFDNMKNAIVAATALASFGVEKFGTQRIENLSQDEIAKRIGEIKKMTAFTI